MIWNLIGRFLCWHNRKRKFSELDREQLERIKAAWRQMPVKRGGFGSTAGGGS